MGYRKQEILHNIESKGVQDACEERAQDTDVSQVQPIPTETAWLRGQHGGAHSSPCPLPLYDLLVVLKQTRTHSFKSQIVLKGINKIQLYWQSKLCATTQINLRIIMLSERSQTLKNTFYIKFQNFQNKSNNCDGNQINSCLGSVGWD